MSIDSTEPPERVPRRTRWLAILVLAALVAGAGSALAVRLLGGGSPASTSSPGAGSETRPERSHMLLAVEGEGEALPALALLADTSEGGVVVLLPATTVVEVPGIGPRTLAKALVEAGAEGLAVSVANAVPIKVPAVIVGSASDVAGVVDGAGGVAVDVPDDVVVTEDGEQRTLFSRGETPMSGGEFVRYHTASFPGKLELDRVVRQGAGWRGLLEALATERAARALPSWSGDGDRSRAADIIGKVADDPTVMSLPVSRLSLAGEDLYQVDDEDLDPLRRALEAFVTTSDEKGKRVRLLVGVDALVGPRVGHALVDAGYVIVLTGRASRPYEVTQVVVVTENVPGPQRAGRAIVDLLGVGSVGVTDRPSSVADIMLVVGMDWAEANGFTPR